MKRPFFTSFQVHSRLSGSVATLLLFAACDPSTTPAVKTSAEPRVDTTAGAAVETNVLASSTDGVAGLPQNLEADPRKAPPNPWRVPLEKAIGEIVAESDPDRRAALIARTLESVSAGDAAQALAVLTNPDFEKSGATLRERLLRRWAEAEPAAAAAWVARLSSGEMRSEAYAAVAAGWQATDATAALAWARGIQDPNDRDSAVLPIAYELARSQPVDAIQLGIELQAHERRDELLRFSAAQWADKEPREAVDWASRVEDDGLRGTLLRDILTAWGETDPKSAATAAVESIPTGRTQNDTVVGIVQRWAQTEPQIAATWVAVFPEGELRETAARELVSVWAEQSVEAAGHWLDTLEPGSFRDTAISAYSNSVFPRAPGTAALWAVEIQDAARRLETVERLATDWLEVDAAAARVWIDRSPLPAETKARLLGAP